MASGGRGDVGAERAIARSGAASGRGEILEPSMATSVAPTATFGGIEFGGPERGRCKEGGFVRLAVVRCGVWGDVWRWS